jgi:hypothetical protein
VIGQGASGGLVWAQKPKPSHPGSDLANKSLGGVLYLVEGAWGCAAERGGGSYWASMQGETGSVLTWLYPLSPLFFPTLSHILTPLYPSTPPISTQLISLVVAVCVCVELWLKDEEEHARLRRIDHVRSYGSSNSVRYRSSHSIFHTADKNLNIFMYTI